MTTRVINKKSTLLGSDTVLPDLGGTNIVTALRTGPGNSITLAPVLNTFLVTVGTTEVIIDSQAISLTSDLNTISCFFTHFINSNDGGSGRTVTYRVRVGDANGTIIGSFAVTNSAISFIRFVSQLANIPKETTLIVATWQYTGTTGESGTREALPRVLSVVTTQSNDSHFGELIGSNTQRTTNETIL